MWLRRHGAPDQRQKVTGRGTTELEVGRMNNNTSKEQSLNESPY